jgi:hypothetical protein
MPSTRNAVLHLPAEGGVEAAILRDVLATMHDAHSGYIAFDRILSDTERAYRELLPFSRRRLRESPFESGYGPPFGYAAWNRPLVADFFVYAGELLLVTRVELGSPGFLEVLGALNPLETIRKYLQDRHERRKDREYRNREEERKLGLENDLREIEAVSRRIEIARQNGVPEEQIIPLLQQLLGRPLDALGALQDRGVIDGTAAEIQELESGEGTDS